jgi:hypothetical protein
VETSTKNSPQEEEEEALQKPQTEDRRHGKETASFKRLGNYLLCPKIKNNLNALAALL